VVGGRVAVQILMFCISTMEDPSTNQSKPAGKGSYSFEELELYKLARNFRKAIYNLIKDLPPEEKFNLASQMRRAATSLTNNIADGHGRYHYQENIQFIRQARGSLEEILDDINICSDEHYSGLDISESLKIEGFELIHRMNGYIVYLRKMKLGERSGQPWTSQQSTN
jgi:four helix bundle protein